MKLALHRVGIIPRPILNGRVVCVTLVSICQEPGSKRIEAVERDNIMKHATKQLRLNLTIPCVVQTLIHSRFDPPILLGDFTNLRYLPSLIVAGPKTLEVAFLIQLVDFA
jgi:hypothetical protein